MQKRPHAVKCRRETPRLRKEIEARLRAETRLRESEERCRRLFEVGNDAVLLVDCESLRIIDANSAALKLYGYRKQELLSLKVDALSAEPGKSRRAVESGERYVFCSAHRKKDGSIFPVEIEAGCYDNAGRTFHVAVVRDISARMRAEELQRVLYDLSGELGDAVELDAILGLCAKAALRASKMECCRIYLPHGAAGRLALAHEQWAGSPHAPDRARLDAAMQRVRLQRRGAPVYGNRRNPGSARGISSRGSGRAAMAILPIIHEGRCIGRLAAASLTLSEMPLDARLTIETIGGIAGRAIVRCQATAAYRTSQEKLSAVLSAIPDIVILKNRHFVYDVVNPAFCAFLGKKPQAIVGRTDFDLFPPEEAARFRADDEKILLSGLTLTQDEMATGKGGRKWFSVCKAPFRNRDNVIEGILVTVRDITARRRMEEDLKMHRDRLDELVRIRTARLTSANKRLKEEVKERRRVADELRKSEEKFRKLLNNVPIAISVVNRDGTVVYVNKKHPEILGYSLEDVPTVESWWSQAYPDEGVRARVREAWGPIVKRASEGEMVGPVRRTVLCKDGSMKNLELRFTSAADKLIVTFDDMTERDATLAALRRNSDMLSRSQQLALVGSWEMDIRTEKITATDELTRMLGLTPAENEFLMGRLIKIAHPDDRQKLLRHYHEARERGVYPDIEFRIVHADGSVHDIHTRGTITFDEEGVPSGLIGASQDVTEQRRLQREVLRIEDSERQAIGQEMHDSLGQILTAASFKGSVFERLCRAQGPALAAGAAELIGLIDQAKEEARLIARGLIPVEAREKSLSAALYRLAKNSSALFRIPCLFVCREEVVARDHSAAVHLYRIAQEAITNAAKHSGATRIVLTLRKTGQRVAIAVRDNGKGFSGRTYTGMGMNIMRYRADLINAALTVKSSKQEGTLIQCVYGDK